MTDINQQINAYQATKKLALELINSDSLQKQTSILLDELLPSLAADIENDLHEKGARLLYTLKVQRHKPIVHILLKTRNHLHERLIFFDSKNLHVAPPTYPRPIIPIFIYYLNSAK